jgi:hypothetical protein
MPPGYKMHSLNVLSPSPDTAACTVFIAVPQEGPGAMRTVQVPPALNSRDVCTFNSCEVIAGMALEVPLLV